MWKWQVQHTAQTMNLQRHLIAHELWSIFCILEKNHAMKRFGCIFNKHKDIPYLTLTGKLWNIFHEYFEKKSLKRNYFFKSKPPIPPHPFHSPQLTCGWYLVFAGILWADAVEAVLAVSSLHQTSLTLRKKDKLTDLWKLAFLCYIGVYKD